MNKCKVCGSEMVELFSSWGCPNDCKGEASLNPPEEKGAVTHSRSGGSVPTEKEIKEQKRKSMLAALANFNTTACKLINSMTDMTKTTDDIAVAVGKFGKELADLRISDEQLDDGEKIRGQRATQILVDEFASIPVKNAVIMSYKGRCYACFSLTLQVMSCRLHYNVKCAECGINGPCANSVQGAIDAYQERRDKHFARIETDWYRQEYKCDFTCDLLEPIPMPSVMEEAIQAETEKSMRETEREIMTSMGIPSYLLNKNNNNELTNADLESLCKPFKTIISYNHDDEIEIKIDKLSPQNGDLLIFTMPLNANDKAYEDLADQLRKLDLEAKYLILPENIKVKHVPFGDKKDEMDS